VYTLAVWRFEPGQAKPVASFPLIESSTYQGLFSVEWSEVELRGGFMVRVSAERVPSGEIHLGATHSDETGISIIRVHPKDGPPYVVSLQKSDT
jgi:hypothetical protein